MTLLLMPKATAVWLIDNTTLTFQQIADFVGLHTMEIQSVADGEVSIRGVDPVRAGQLSREEISRCEADPDRALQILERDIPQPVVRHKGPRYTPLSKRGDKPDAIAWILKNHPELSDNQIKKLVGTTKNTIEAVRTRSHWNIANIRSRHPVELGLCRQEDLRAMVEKAQALRSESSLEEPEASTDSTVV